MTYNPTVWQDQIVTDPTKYKITRQDGTEELVNIEREPGEIIQEGTRITSDRLNNIEQGISDNENEIDTLGTHVAELEANKVDKVSGKGLSTNDYTDAEKSKLAGIEVGANNYQHPSTHSLDMITETTTKKIMTSTERTKLSNIEDNANNYIHPSIHSASMITQDSTHRFVTDSEKAIWNGKLNASSYTAADVLAKVKSVDGAGSGLDADTIDSKQASGTLDTTEKTNLVTAINEVFQSVSNGKAVIASAITDMNQTASGGDTFSALALAIKAISSDANASTANVLSGKTFYQGGVKRTGTMASRGTGGTVTPGTSNQTKYAGYYSSNITILGDANLIAGNIKEDISIFGVNGTLKPSPISNFVTGSKAVDSDDVLRVTLGFKPDILLIDGPHWSWLYWPDLEGDSDCFYRLILGSRFYFDNDSYYVNSTGFAAYCDDSGTANYVAIKY